MEKRYDNYVFDLYGTLVDIHTDEEKPALWEPLALYLRLKGLPWQAGALRERYRTLCRDAAPNAEREADVREVFRALCREKGGEPTETELRDLACLFRALSTERLRLFPGARELLSALRAAGKRLWLLSNAQADFTRPELRCLGLEDCFDGILLSSEAGVKKPSAAFFGLLEKNGLRRERTVMVGNDDLCDCRGAAAAGLDSVYIRTEQSPPRRRPLPENCREIKSLAELLAPDA